MTNNTHRNTKVMSFESNSISSDVQQQQLNSASAEAEAESFLETLSTVISNADEMLSNLSSAQAGKALQSTISGLAEGIGQVGRELSSSDEGARRMLARAVMEDFQSAAFMAETKDFTPLPPPSPNSKITDSMEDSSELNSLSTYSKISESDMLQNIDSAASILLDVENALLSVSNDEAEELAEVSITVGRVFLVMLRSVVENLSPADLAGTGEIEENLDLDVDLDLKIELLDEEGNEEDPQQRKSRIRRQKLQQNRNNNKNKTRMRLTWPPLGPKVASAAKWTKNDLFLKVSERSERALLKTRNYTSYEPLQKYSKLFHSITFVFFSLAPP